jgi:hypothetical protein
MITGARGSQSPDDTLFFRIHFAADGAVEVVGKVHVVGQAAQDTEPAWRVRSDLKIKDCRCLKSGLPDGIFSSQKS